MSITKVRVRAILSTAFDLSIVKETETGHKINISDIGNKQIECLNLINYEFSGEVEINIKRSGTGIVLLIG